MYTRLTIAFFPLLTLGCFNRDKTPGGGDTAFLGVRVADVVCEPDASAVDDLFSVAAYTYGEVTEVKVIVSTISGATHSFLLGERAASSWYGEAWGDDLELDCDDMAFAQFEIIASGPDGSAGLIY